MKTVTSKGNFVSPKYSKVFFNKTGIEGYRLDSSSVDQPFFPTNATTQNLPINSNISFFRTKHIGQQKQAANQFNNIYDQKSDAMTDKFMCIKESDFGKQKFFDSTNSSIQRKYEACKKEKKLPGPKLEGGENVHSKPISNVSANYFLPHNLAKGLTLGLKASLASPLYNNIPLFSSKKIIQPKIAISAPGDPYEQAADRIEKRILIQPYDNAGAFTENGSKTGLTKLAESGRKFYQPFVGSAVHRANLHIGAHADELTKLSKAKGLTFGNDVYIPKNKFAPDTSVGRALIGHELKHLDHSQQAPTQLFRSEEEPHYPTVEEQARIEILLGRERTASTVTTETVGKDGEVVKEETVVLTGKNLTSEERIALAEKLKAPFDSAIDAMVARAENEEKANSSGIYTDDQLYVFLEQAKMKIYEKYGKYITRSITLTRIDTSVADRIAKDEILVKASDMTTAAPALARTVAGNFCQKCEESLAGLNSESKRAVVNRMASKAVSERPEFWQKAAKLKVAGSYNDSNRSITMPYAGNNILPSAVHELIHSLAHPAFRAAFGDEDLANEGFTEYFTRQVAGGASYPKQTSKVTKVQNLTSGPFLIDVGVGGDSEESLRLAYFSGRLDLVGWKSTSEAEREAVAAAGGAEEWDPDKAKEYAEKYKAATINKQDTHNNILGVGLYFKRESGSEPTFNVRYARVVTQTQPYSRGRLLLEGQVIGSPVAKTLGGSLGIAGEYQEPYFYATGGVRFIGEATLQGDSTRLDVSPVVGAGFRAWQKIRVGAEGFVLLPLVGGNVQVGGGAVVGLEF